MHPAGDPEFLQKALIVSIRLAGARDRSIASDPLDRRSGAKGARVGRRLVAMIDDEEMRGVELPLRIAALW